MSLNLNRLELPITIRPAAPVSDDDLMCFSEENKPYRVERNRKGEIRIMTPVGGIGGTHEIYVATTLYQWNEIERSGVVFGPNAGFNLNDGSCLAPDACWISTEKWNALTLDQQSGYPPLCPEFIVEVRSRTDSRRLLQAKMQLWLDNGAKLAWLVDPVDGTATIYRIHTAPETMSRPGVLRGEGSVAGFELRCERLWGNL